MISRCQRRRLVRLAKSIICKRRGRCDSSGISSSFFKLSESWGVKFTRKGSGYMAETFARHRRMWRLHIAPFCFGLFSCKLGGGREYHGYIVQLIDVCCDLIRRDKSLAYMFRLTIHMEDVRQLKKVFEKLYKIIKEKAKKCWSDNHTQNFGLLNHNWVVLDWGSESFNDFYSS